MIAGTLARLEEPSEEPLESAAARNSFPAIEVENSQQTFDERTVQSGTAAERTLDTKEDVTVTDGGGGVSISTTRLESRKEVTTEWIADVEGSGLLVARSTEGDGDFAFPFGLLGAQANRLPERIRVDVAAVKDGWQDEDRLQEVTMASAGDDLATSIEYGAAARPDAEASKGVGFELAWENDIVEGVIWESGYVACFNVDLTERFVQFVLEEIWPHCYVPEDDEEEDEQATLDEATDTSGNGEERTTDADACERCGGGELHGLEPRGGIMLCNVCRDALDEGIVTIDEIREEVQDGE